MRRSIFHHMTTPLGGWLLMTTDNSAPNKCLTNRVDAAVTFEVFIVVLFAFLCLSVCVCYCLPPPPATPSRMLLCTT